MCVCVCVDACACVRVCVRVFVGECLCISYGNMRQLEVLPNSVDKRHSLGTQKILRSKKKSSELACGPVAGLDARKDCGNCDMAPATNACRLSRQKQIERTAIDAEATAVKINMRNMHASA